MYNVCNATHGLVRDSTVATDGHFVPLCSQENWIVATGVRRVFTLVASKLF